MNRIHSALVLTIGSTALVLSGSMLGCESKSTSPPQGASTAKDDHAGHDHDGHGHGAGQGHGDGHDDHGHGEGPAIALGSSTIGGFGVTVTRDAGAITAGKEAAIDATVIPAAAGGSKVSAVRFWIGTADAKGSTKAKADIEDPKEPNRWHTHVEIPNPMPAGGMLWVEIEAEGGTKSSGSFDLKS
jgi:hypothetical protein